MFSSLRKSYAQLITSGGQLLLLFAGFHSNNRIVWLWCLGIMPIVSLFAWYSTLRRQRLINSTPTSRIASAAQGYVELMGRGKLGSPPLISKLRVLPCLWYRWKVEDRDSENKWRTLDQGESSDCFVLVDESGECVVNPEDAEIITKHQDSWISGNYRYTEWKLIQNDALYALGEFKTVGGSTSALTHNDLVREVLIEWKSDNANLLKRFDLDNNGMLDMDEWMLARQAAKREANKRLAEVRAAPETHLLLRPRDGRLFLLSNYSPAELAGKYVLWAWLHLLILFGSLGGLAWVLSLH